MVYRCRRECGRDRNPLLGHRPIRQDQDIHVRQNVISRLAAQSIQRGLDAGGALLGGPGGVERGGAESPIQQFADRPDLGQVIIGQDRLRDFQPLVRAGLAAEQVRTWPNHRNKAHHQFLADRIDRRIGDLGEVLLEVVVEQLGALGEHRNRNILAHRPDRILSRHGHGFEEELQIFLRVAEGLLSIEQRCHIRAKRLVSRRRRGQVRQFELRASQPFRIGLGGGKGGLDLLVLDDASLLHVDQQHLAWLQPPFTDDPLFRNGQHPDLRSHDHIVLVGDDEPGGTQSIAVERRADLATVGKGHGGRTIPWLHQGGVIFVESLALGIHQRIAGPGLWDQHHDGVGQRIATCDQQLQGVIEAGRVRLSVRYQRPHLVEIGTQEVRLQRAAARVHPVDVTAHRIDLAVVSDEPVGVRQFPRREGVGRKALVHQR